MTERELVWFWHAPSQKKRPAIILALNSAAAFVAWGTKTARPDAILCIQARTRQAKHLQLTHDTYFYRGNFAAAPLADLEGTGRRCTSDVALALRERIGDAHVQASLEGLVAKLLTGSSE